MLDSLLATLDPRSEQIVRLYYQHDLTQTEIGRQLGYSQMHVSRLLRQAITQLAKTAETAQPEPTPRPDRTPAVGRATEALPASIQYLTDRQNALHA
jgi:Sigma-70, region 4